MDTSPSHVEKLSFVLENCEVIYVDISQCESANVWFGTIHQKYTIHDSDLWIHEYTNDFIASLDLETIKLSDGEKMYASKEDVLKRLKVGDITSVCIHSRDSERQVYVVWKGKDPMGRNEAAKIAVKNGDLIITINNQNLWQHLKFKLKTFWADYISMPWFRMKRKRMWQRIIRNGQKRNAKLNLANGASAPPVA